MKKDNSNLPFVCTFQEDIAQVLLENNYTLLSKESNGKYIFVNKGTLKFDECNSINNEDIKKVFYTNVLCMTK